MANAISRPVHISSLHLYPVKSLRGHSVTSAEIDDWGFAGDRRFMVVTPEGQFLTQRQLPRMALVETELTAASLALAATGHGSVCIPFAALAPAPRTVTVWKNTVTADDCGDEAAEWLTRCLGLPLRLVRMGGDYHRPVKPSEAKPDDVVSFADAHPFLIISEASLTDLNARLAAKGEATMPMNRFRPNLVVTGCEPYAEDTWSKLNIAGILFRTSGLCARCPITTTNQETAERGKEPLKTLATYRRDPVETTNLNFGVNLIHETKRGTIKVGAKVALL